jgi:hypothetical protein
VIVTGARFVSALVALTCQGDDGRVVGAVRCENGEMVVLATILVAPTVVVSRIFVVSVLVVVAVGRDDITTRPPPSCP